MRWFVLRVKNKKAQAIADKIGWDHCWLPVGKKWTKPARKHKPIEVEINLIPGWLFVQEHRHAACQGLDGVYGTLKYGRQGVLWIKDEDLNELRDACNPAPDAVEPKLDAVHEVFSVGSTVKLRGLLYGRLGVVTAILPGDLYKVQVDFMSVQVHARLLERPN